MSDAEFDRQAAAIAAQVLDADFEVRVAAACRGSGNPAALAWLAEALGIGASTDVVDLGAGLGGPAAWLTERFGCTVVAAEPMARAVAAARELFGLACVRSAAASLPFRRDAFDVALLLGVISVVDRPEDALAEARRVAHRVGVLEYCATGHTPVRAGGSLFPTAAGLIDHASTAGWVVEQSTSLTIDPPQRWSDAAAEAGRRATDGSPDDAAASEAEVVAAIERGHLQALLLTASRPGRPPSPRGRITGRAV